VSVENVDGAPDTLSADPRLGLEELHIDLEPRITWKEFAGLATVYLLGALVLWPLLTLVRLLVFR
jgi:hypothetical protein